MRWIPRPASICFPAHSETTAWKRLTPREEIIDLFSRYRLRLLPVVDIEDRLLGVIRQSAVIQAAQEEAATDMQAMVGVSRDERQSSALGANRASMGLLRVAHLQGWLKKSSMKKRVQ